MKPPRRFERELGFVRNRFSPKGYLGLHLTIGVVVILLCSWCFSEIAEMLGPGAPILDHRVMTWFQAWSRPGLTTAARIFTALGSIAFLTIASVCCALFFVQRRAWARLLTVLLTMIGGSLLNIFLKHFFHRQRPVLENPLVTLTSFGFPSGHTMGATLFYGLLALFLAQWLKDWRWRLLLSALAVLIVVIIGVTRIYLGAHYLTDVLAAMTAGAVWLVFCWTTVETFRRRRDAASRAELTTSPALPARK